MNHGSCLCGDVTWEVGAFTLLTNCHCSMCRKVHGSAFATFAGAAAGDFRWRSGEDKVAVYESTAGAGRPFCSRCGSVVPVVMESGAFIPAGNVAGEIGRALDSHMFVDSKAPWHTITDDVACHAAYPPGYGDVEPVRQTPRPPPGKDAVGGSCLCGAVWFEFDPPASGMVCCHCSRCRRARSSAFSTQVFCASDQFRWLSGADALTSWKVPESTAFIATFCANCSSPMPYNFGEVVMMPAGALDQDPGLTPTAHIFAGSKAAWFEIPDDVDQFEAMP